MGWLPRLSQSNVQLNDIDTINIRNGMTFGDRMKIKLRSSVLKSSDPHAPVLKKCKCVSVIKG